MKQIDAIIDGALIRLNVPETSMEYTEGARASGNILLDTEGYLFRYDVAQKLGFENTAVPFELKVLYLQSTSIDSNKQAVVMEEGILFKDSSKVATSYNHYKMAIELRKDFCDKFRIGIGSIVTLIEEETSDE